MKDMINNNAYDDLYRIAKTTSHNALAIREENELVDVCKLEDENNAKQYIV